MTYGKRIKQAREDLHMTQEQLAEELDISRQAVSKWEAGLSRPTREKLDRLSRILDIPPAEVYFSFTKLVRSCPDARACLHCVFLPVSLRCNRAITLASSVHYDRTFYCS